MKQAIMAFCLLLVLCAYSGAADRQKSFKLVVEPAGARIKVVSGSGLKEKVYRSPASVTASVADDPERAKKNVIEISHDRYKPAVIPLASVGPGEVLKVKLEKILRKQLKFQMVSPTQSDTLQIKDGQVKISMMLDERQMQLSLTNSTPFPIRILWQRAGYTDAAGQYHRVMHPGIKYDERNRSFPYQTVMPFMTIHQPILPVDMVLRDHTTRPLFPPEEVERFRGKTFELQLPIEIENKGVVPYTFKVKVLGMVLE
jgi:hypothetical protein